MAGILDSLRKLGAFMIFIVILAISTIAIFELFIAEPINLPTFLKQLGNITILFAFTLVAIYFLRKIKPILTPRVGLQAASILQFLMLVVAILVMFFGIFDIFSVPLSALLASAGIITVTVGLIISTFVGGSTIRCVSF